MEIEEKQYNGRNIPENLVDLYYSRIIERKRLEEE